MGNFQKGDRSGGFRQGSRGGFRGGNNGSRKDVTMHKAICDECHKSCEVPFRPSGDKPVYCSDCFNKRDDGGSDRRPRREFSDRGPKRDFRGKSAQSFTKPVLTPQSDGFSRQLSEINSKIDRLVSVIEKFTQPKIELKPKEVSIKKIEIKKTPIIKNLKKTKSTPKKIVKTKKSK